MYQILTKCPVCGGETEVTRIYCPNCDTTVEGHFHATANPFAALTPEQAQFILTFVRCEGRFNRMEEEMKLSYPTLRGRLNEIVRALGYEPGKEEAPAALTAEERRAILEELDQGAISWEEAQASLRGEKYEDAAQKEA